MTKKRLNKHDRKLLMDLVKSKVVISMKDEKKIEIEYNKACILFNEFICGKFNQNDMKILIKYDCASSRSDFYIIDIIEDFTFNKFKFINNKNLLIPISFCCSRVSLPEDIAKQFKKLNNVSDIAKENRNKIRRDYYVLIKNSKTYEDVLDIWDEAIEVENKIRTDSNLPSIITPNLIDRIKNDASKRIVR